MSFLVDYFAAGSDQEAAPVIDRIGGPTSQNIYAPGSDEIRPDPTLAIYDTVSTKGIDPVVQMGKLESLLTGHPYDEIVADPRSGHALEIRNEGECVVCTITDSLMTALAEADEAQLSKVAGLWSQTDEFYGHGDPDELIEFLTAFSSLAERAVANGRSLYCWLSV